jgi:hypothetical protein
MGTGNPIPGIERGRDVTLTTHPHLVPRSRMSKSYIISPPWRLHGVYGEALLLIYKKVWVEIHILYFIFIGHFKGIKLFV